MVCRGEAVMVWRRRDANPPCIGFFISPPPSTKQTTESSMTGMMGEVFAHLRWRTSDSGTSSLTSRASIECRPSDGGRSVRPHTCRPLARGHSARLARMAGTGVVSLSSLSSRHINMGVIGVGYVPLAYSPPTHSGRARI